MKTFTKCSNYYKLPNWLHIVTCNKYIIYDWKKNATRRKTLCPFHDTKIIFKELHTFRAYIKWKCSCKLAKKESIHVFTFDYKFILLRQPYLMHTIKHLSQTKKILKQLQLHFVIFQNIPFTLLHKNLQLDYLSIRFPFFRLMSLLLWSVTGGSKFTLDKSQEKLNHLQNFEGYTTYSRDANLAKSFAVFLGLKRSILDENFFFSPIVQNTCVLINLEKKQYFAKSCSIFEVFS